MRTLLTTSLFVFGLLFNVGCNQTRVPEELKNLAPVTVTVMDGTQPVEGVSVALNSKGGSQGFFASHGVTDTKGVAAIQSTRSSYSGKGVPPGTYSVVLIKTVELPPDLEPLEEDQDNPVAAAAKQAKRDEFLKQNRLIPEKLTLSSSSPIELTVADKSGVTLEVDIAQYR